MHKRLWQKWWCLDRGMPTRPAERHRAAGQSLVEFSMMLIFLTVLLVGVLDLGRAYMTYLALKDAASEGAYFGSAFPQCVDADGINSHYGDGSPNYGSPGCADPNNIPYRIRNSSPTGGLVEWTPETSRIKIDLPCGTTLPCELKPGQSLTVTVSYRYQMLTPFVGAVANTQHLTFTASSSAVLVRVPTCSVNPCK
jgi:hypothetical protein